MVPPFMAVAASAQPVHLAAAVATRPSVLHQVAFLVQRHSVGGHHARGFGDAFQFEYLHVGFPTGFGGFQFRDGLGGPPEQLLKLFDCGTNGPGCVALAGASPGAICGLPVRAAATAAGSPPGFCCGHGLSGGRSARHTPRTNTIIPSYRGTYRRAWMALSEPARWGHYLPRWGRMACPGCSQRAERRVACDPLL